MTIGTQDPQRVKLREAWLAAIQGRELAGLVQLPTFADGVANMAVLDAIRSSASQGGASVRIDYDGVA